MTALYIILGVIGFILLITAAVLAAKVTIGVSWCGDFVFSLSVGGIFRKSFTAGDIKSITSKQPEKPAVKKKEKNMDSFLPVWKLHDLWRDYIIYQQI